MKKELSFLGRYIGALIGKNTSTIVFIGLFLLAIVLVMLFL
ncbi:MAG: hypothetical protein ACP5FL_08170 [Thermoplasmatota archaeon]